MDPRLGQMHQVMLGDQVRLEAYDAALCRPVSELILRNREKLAVIDLE